MDGWPAIRVAVAGLEKVTIAQQNEMPSVVVDGVRHKGHLMPRGAGGKGGVTHALVSHARARHPQGSKIQNDVCTQRKKNTRRESTPFC